MIAYLDLDEDIRYRDGSELLDQYHEAVESDKSIIDMSQPRLFWGPDDTGELRSAIKKLSRDIVKRTPVRDPMMVDGAGPYLTHPL
jgi:hypothetical protein